MEAAFIINDIQAPLYDPSAWSVALQIGADVKPDIVVVNGDLVEFRHLSMRFPALKGQSEQWGATAAEECLSAVGLLKELKRAVRAKRYIFNEGNHEWRLFRALSQIPQILEILKLPGVARAVSVEEVFGLKALGFEYTGTYPHGCWLFKRTRPEDNVFVHHAYTTRKKAGYHANSEIDVRMTNVVCGHGERLGVVWRRAAGDRRFFGAEGGNLSILGEPEKGDNIYTSCPFSAPEMLDRQQGFTVIYADGAHYQPISIAIHHGKALFGGKLYRA